MYYELTSSIPAFFLVQAEAVIASLPINAAADRALDTDLGSLRRDTAISRQHPDRACAVVDLVSSSAPKAGERDAIAVNDAARNNNLFILISAGILLDLSDGPL